MTSSAARAIYLAFPAAMQSVGLSGSFFTHVLASCVAPPLGSGRRPERRRPGDARLVAKYDRLVVCLGRSSLPAQRSAGPLDALDQGAEPSVSGGLAGLLARHRDQGTLPRTEPLVRLRGPRGHHHDPPDDAAPHARSRQAGADLHAGNHSGRDAAGVSHRPGGWSLGRGRDLANDPPLRPLSGHPGSHRNPPGAYPRHRPGPRDAADRDPDQPPVRSEDHLERGTRLRRPAQRDLHGLRRAPADCCPAGP